MEADLSQLCYNPLYKQIAQSILKRAGIDYHPGERMPSERQLAEYYNVSLITIRGALALLRQEGLITSGRGKGIKLVRLPRQKPVAILIELDYEHPEFNPYYREVTETVSQNLTIKGIPNRIYKGTLRPGQRPEKLTCQSFLEDLRNEKIGGVVAIGTDPTLGWLEEVNQQQLPVTGSNSRLPSSVSWNIRSLIDHVLTVCKAFGYRHIATMGWEGYREENSTIRDYYKRALKRNNLPYQTSWLKSDLYPLFKGAGWDALREIWSANSQKPEVLFIMDGNLLPEICDALNRIDSSLLNSLMIISSEAVNPAYNHLKGIHYFKTPASEVADELAEVTEALLKGQPSIHVTLPVIFPDLGIVRKQSEIENVLSH